MTFPSLVFAALASTFLATAAHAEAQMPQSWAKDGVHFSETDDAGAVDTPEISDQAQRDALSAVITSAIARSDFATLDALEKRFRTERTRLPSGIWKLSSYYIKLRRLLKERFGDGQCGAGALPFADSWLKTSPASPAAVIVKAELLKNIGWCHRGNGYAGSVSEDSWRNFHDYLGQSFDLLTAQADIATVDPQFYVVMEDVYLGLGRKPQEFARLVDEAVHREPYYYPIYEGAEYYYRPQWHGDYDAIERLARLATSKTARHDGAMAYVAVYWNLIGCNCDLDRLAFDPVRLRQSMKETVERYPNSRTAGMFAKFACRLGYASDMVTYFDMVAPDDYWAWDGKDDRERTYCLAMADLVQQGKIGDGKLARTDGSVSVDWAPATAAAPN